MSVFLLLAAVAPCLLLLNVTASPSSCPISISTLEHVTICPKSEREWNERAKEKGCETLAQHQKCTSVETFSYHCILNADATRLVEVCAPKWFITGYCARFSTQEQRIINDPGIDCTKFIPPCPPRYNSTEAHKYQNCYAEVERTSNVNVHDSSVFSSPVVWTLTALSCGLLIALIIITTLYIRGRKQKSSDQNIEGEGQCSESGPLSPRVQKEAPRPRSEQCSESGPSSSKGKQLFVRLKSAEEQSSGNGKKETKARPEKMLIKTLSGVKTIECNVKGIQSVAELKIAVAEALNSSKDLIEIVDKRTLTLYHDDIDFPSFLKHEDDINVIERTETRESHYEQVKNNQPEIASDQEEYDNDENVLFLADRDCTHITNPDLLFKHIHHEVLIEENTKITCLKCGMEMMTDNALQMCNMSEDETCFYKEKIIRNRGLEHQLLQLGMQWSVKSEYADNINKS